MHSDGIIGYPTQIQMPVESEEVGRPQGVEIEGINLDGWSELSFEEMKARILESGKRELLADDFLILFQKADDEQKEEIASSLVAEGISFVETPDEDEPQKTGKENLTTSGPVYVKDMLELDDDTDQPIKMDDNLGLYLKEAGKVSLLTAEKEVDLAKRIKRGEKASKLLIEKSKGRLVAPKGKAELQSVIQDGMAAREHLVLANSRLVISVAKRHKGRGVPFEDLIQEGNIGLIRSALKFEYQRGLKFSTYATWWIRQAVTRAINDQSRTIRLPVYMGEQISRLKHASNALSLLLGRDPTTQELAKYLGIEQKRVEYIQDKARKPISLETPQFDEEDSPLKDFIEDEGSPTPVETADKSSLREQIQDVLQALPPREELVLRLRYRLKDNKFYTLEQVGRKMGITRERVRQIEAQALSRLRAPSQKQKLIDYLEE